jgi:SAM-dependent methyltransferase
VTNAWVDPERARNYLGRVDRLARKREGEVVLVDDVADVLPGRVLDLGCGDGRLAALLLAAVPGSTAVGVDLSPTMLEAARERFGGSPDVTLIEARLDDPLPVEGPFDVVVSSFAIHHVTDERKATLAAEAAALLRPGGIFANLDIVRAPTRRLHERWRAEMGAPDDPADVLCELEPQLGWLRAAGLEDVDCTWKWRSLALMRGARSTADTAGEPHPS